MSTIAAGFRELLDFLQIWKNPIFSRYCRSCLSLRRLSIWTLLVIMLSIYAIVIKVAFSMRFDQKTEVEAYRLAFLVLFFLQMFIMLVLGMANVSGGMTRERDEGVIDYQRILSLSPPKKVVGYLFGMPVKEYALTAMTLPFTAYAIFRGEIALSIWLPFYITFFCSTLLYHMTGVLAGTVIKNRRWAFLSSMAIVFCLYTIIPEVSKFGINVFRYLTIRPVLEESWSYFLPRETGSVVQIIQSLNPSVSFFGLKFPSFVFILISQAGLILTFFVMLCRFWHRQDMGLLGKGWAVLFFGWIQFLILGNALPAIPTGEIFPSVGFSQQMTGGQVWNPDWIEVAAVCGFYGLVTFVLIMLIVNIITPDRNKQIRGWQRARKFGYSRLNWNDNASSALPATLALCTLGAAGWFLFLKGLVESPWFPGHHAELKHFLYVWLSLLVVGVGFQSLLEWQGRIALLFAGIIAVVVPLLTGLISGILDQATLSVWITALCPLTLPIAFSFTELGIGQLDLSSIARAIPYAFKFSLLVHSFVSLFIVYRLFQARKMIRTRIRVD